VIIVFSFVVKGSNNNVKSINENKLQFVEDTLKPDFTQEKRITRIEIINGKKKIIEKIIKMRGDSIIEEKIIKKEEDVLGDNPSFDFGDDQMSGQFKFRQIKPSKIDSMFAQNFDKFHFGTFGSDSMMQGFGFSLGPDFQFSFGDSFLNKDLFEQFDSNRMMDPKMEKQFEQMFRGFDSDKLGTFPAPNSKSKPDNKGFKTLKQIITEQLYTDGFISNFDDTYIFELNENELKINGKSQEDTIYNKYKEVIEDNIGIELENKFDYKFSNSKSLKNNLRRL
jgi:hypothetical protein